MEYLDFEVQVEPGASGDYDVSARSPAGDAGASMRFPYDRLALSNKLQSLQIALLRSGGPGRRTGTTEDQAVRDLGRDLFEALFSGEVGGRLAASRGIAQGKQRGLRIKLRISAPELLSLPWEYLFDPGGNDYLALSASTPVVRYIPLAQPIEPLQVAPPLRILGLVAGPSDMEPLDAVTERQRLEEALADLRDKGLVELRWVAGETWQDLQDVLMRERWHVFHFVGHGGFSEARGQGVIYLADEKGKARELSASDLALLLGDHDPLRLAVLNSCDTAQGTETDVFSSTAAALVKRGTPAVVAMQFQITDVAAIQFSRVFYTAMTYGLPVDGAVAEARKSVALQVANTLEWGTPVLFMRSPDGALFDMPESEAGAEKAVAAAVNEPATAVAAAADLPAAFEVIPTQPTLKLDANRTGTSSWAVRNLTGKRLSVRAWPTPQQNAAAGWFTLQGEPERLLEVGASQSISVSITVPPEVDAGTYAVRLDVASAANPDDEWANGQPVSFDVPKADDKPKRAIPWRWLALGGAGLAVIAVISFILVVLFGGDDGDPVSCGGELTNDVFGHLHAAQPSYVLNEALCIHRMELFPSTLGSGVAQVMLEGETVYTIDLDNFDAIGVEGAGSGERIDDLEVPIGVRAGETLSLNQSDCGDCDLSVWFVAGRPPTGVAPGLPLRAPLTLPAEVFDPGP